MMIYSENGCPYIHLRNLYLYYLAVPGKAGEASKNCVEVSQKIVEYSLSRIFYRIPLEIYIFNLLVAKHSVVATKQCHRVVTVTGNIDGCCLWPVLGPELNSREGMTDIPVH